MSMASRCYNKGCGKEFDPLENNDDSCQHHPGQPVFHDALKGWSCCNRRTTDFTEFLNIPGCTQEKHNGEKPIEEEKPPTLAVVDTVREAPTPMRIVLTEEVRPSDAETLQPLPVTVGASLSEALHEQLKISSAENSAAVGDGIQMGASCKNHGCKTVYEGPSSDTSTCVFHEGTPVFHEGMKFWSCCKKKTTDFNNFLNQEGCTSGMHTWITTEDKKKASDCRLDWHQTATHVIVSVFAKVAIPEKTTVKANQVKLDLNIVFDKGNSFCNKTIILKGVISPSRSSVKLLGAKVEISLKKAHPGSWSTLKAADSSE